MLFLYPDRRYLTALFAAASSRELTLFFPQQINTAVMLRAVLSGSVGFRMFWLNHRHSFRMTGTIRLGPMMTCLIFVMILISDTVIYRPLEQKKGARMGAQSCR